MILSVANILNAGTTRERADGFGMEIVKRSMPKAIKNSDGYSVMNYVCE